MEVICAHCGKPFKRPRKSRRHCCTRSCSIAWSWANPETKAKRGVGIAKAANTPEGKARLAAHNANRWGRPEEHEKMAEQNRRQWADPVTRAERSAAIKADHTRPEARAMYAKIRRETWACPEKRERYLAGIRKARGTPKARARSSELMRERWADPATRDLMLEANREKNRRPEIRERSRARMTAVWAAYREKVGVPEPRRQVSRPSLPALSQEPINSLPAVIVEKFDGSMIRPGPARSSVTAVMMGDPRWPAPAPPVPDDEDLAEAIDIRAGTWMERAIAKASGLDDIEVLSDADYEHRRRA